MVLLFECLYKPRCLSAIAYVNLLNVVCIYIVEIVCLIIVVKCSLNFEY